MAPDLTNFRQDDFVADLEDSLFECNLNLATKKINFHNFNGIFQVFIQIIKYVINKHCPIKSISRKKQIEQGTLDNERHLKFYSKKKCIRRIFLTSTTILVFSTKKFSTKLNKTKFAAKKRFLLQQFDRNKSNSRKTWEAINSPLIKTKSKYSPTRNKLNDNVLDSPSQIAESFNNYFCHIADNLVNTSNSNSINHSIFITRILCRNDYKIHYLLNPLSRVKFTILYKATQKNEPQL